MKSFNEYLFETEETQLDESVSIFLSSLGIGLGGAIAGSVLASLAVYGAVFIVYGYTKTQSKIIISITRLWRSLKKIISGTKDYVEKGPTNENDIREAITDAKRDPKVIKAIDKMDIVKQKYMEELNDVLESLNQRKWKEAKVKLNEKDNEIKNNPIVKNLIIAEVVKITGEPIMFVASPGNESFRAIKEIFDLKTAKMASDATMEFLKKNLMEKDE